MTRNIRLGWKCLPVTNTLAYNTAMLINEVKTFITQALMINALSIVSIGAPLGRAPDMTRNIRLE